MEQEPKIMSMVTIIKVNGLMESNKAKDNIIIFNWEQFIMDNGSVIWKMGVGMRHKLMGHGLKGSLKMGFDMEKEHIMINN